MKVLMLHSISGERNLKKGEVYDLPDLKALLLLRNGNARAIKQVPEVKIVKPEETTNVQINNSPAERTHIVDRGKGSSKGNIKRRR